jgi:autophagy-related protein 13
MEWRREGEEDGQDHDREMTDEIVRGKGKEREGRKGSDLVTSPLSRQRQRSPLSPLSAGERQQRERLLSPMTGTALRTTELAVPTVPASGSTTAASRETTVQSPLLLASPPAPIQLSTSPNRGPMLTNQDDVDERLKRMNETFMRSLEGMGKGGGVARRRDKEKIERDAAIKRGLLLLVSPTEGEVIPRTTSDGGDARTTNASPYPSQSSEQHPDITHIPSPTFSTGTGSGSSPNQPGVLHSQTGLGLGLGRGRGSTSTSTSASTSSEAIGGASQGSEEVIGRMDLYDEMGRRPRRF